MVDFRLYRAGFLPALGALVLLLFALQAQPSPLPSVATPAVFDQAAALQLDRRIVAAAPERAPGSPGDARTGDLVERQFKHVSEGQVAEQTFSQGGSELRNVILTLPGDGDRTIVVLAARDSASGPGAASSAAATATLLELVNEFRVLQHSNTLVFVSTDGAGQGAAGARQFADQYRTQTPIGGVIVLWQPGAAQTRQPYLLESSDGPQSVNSQLQRTAARVLQEQAERSPSNPSPFGELARLALPASFGEQGVLIEDGIPAVGLSSAGDRPLPPSHDQPDDVSAATLGGFGRAALLLAATLDGAPAPPEHGPSAYVMLGGNLVPGWSLSLLALTLLLPAAVACADALRRGRGGPIGWAIGWSVGRSLPFLCALAVLYVLALIGIIARPDFPFDPNRFGVGAGEVIALTLIALVAGAGCYQVRAWRVPAALPSDAAVPGLGLVSVAAVGLAWLANPYLALLLVPIAHLWLLGARRLGGLPWPLVACGAALSLLPVAAAFLNLVQRLDLGAAAPWQLALMIGDGQLGIVSMLAMSLLAGCVIGTVAVWARRPVSVRRRAAPRAPLPATPAPGSSASAAGGNRARNVAMDASTIRRSGADDDQEGGGYEPDERWLSGPLENAGNDESGSAQEAGRSAHLPGRPGRRRTGDPLQESHDQPRSPQPSRQSAGRRRADDQSAPR